MHIRLFPARIKYVKPITGMQFQRHVILRLTTKILYAWVRAS